MICCSLLVACRSKRKKKSLSSGCSILDARVLSPSKERSEMKRKKWMDGIVLGFFLRDTSNEQLATKKGREMND